MDNKGEACLGYPENLMKFDLLRYDPLKSGFILILEFLHLFQTSTLCFRIFRCSLWPWRCSGLIVGFLNKLVNQLSGQFSLVEFGRATIAIKMLAIIMAIRPFGMRLNIVFD